MTRSRSTLRPQRTQIFLPAIAALSASIVVTGCGKKGPPLPPLVRLPAAPAEMTAARRGNEVVLQFTVPVANTDGTRPANVSRVDVYGISGADALPDEELVKAGTRVASVEVKSPRNPDQTIEPGESAENIDPLEGAGLDQGARATVAEQLMADAIGPGSGQGAPPSRSYVAVSVDTRGRPGPRTGRVTVPLIAAPAAPSSASVTYDETSATVTWTPVENASGYFVYEVPAGVSPQGNESATQGSVETRLTPEAVAKPTFTESRVEWGATRCYAVRASAAAGELAVESLASPPACVTFGDSFAPAAPKGLRGVASEGSISLIWEPNGEKDLDGYVVLRGAPGSPLEPIMLSPIKETVFTDNVPAGVRYVYAIAAVDTTGNRSAESNRFEDSAR